jgi:long-chain acyl-CoA synthetase
MNEEQIARPRDVSSLELISFGGAPSATATLRRAHETFPGARLLHIYGATETAPIATTLLGVEETLDTPRARSCGQPAVGVDVEIRTVEGARAAVGDVGEVVVRGPNVMGAYWNKPRETADALVDGWYRTGDLGYMDEEAFLYLVDRAKDMIVTGGENVYSTEVEDVLYRHPAVLEAAVFGIPDAKWGEAVHAVVVPRAPVTTAELIDHCRAAIGAYKVPRGIDLRAEPLPKSGAGKVLKRELRAPFWADRDAMVSGA